MVPDALASSDRVSLSSSPSAHTSSPPSPPRLPPHPTPAQAPLSARRVLSLRSPTLLRFVPDDEFAAVCQNWDFADPRGMKLPSVPGECEGDGWEALTGVVGREDKWVKGEC